MKLGDEHVENIEVIPTGSIALDNALGVGGYPPVVVSGLPNITPIFSRNWLMKMQVVLVLLMVEVSLRSAWLINRA